MDDDGNKLIRELRQSISNLIAMAHSIRAGDTFPEPLDDDPAIRIALEVDARALAYLRRTQPER